jgi:hypothetical protein
MEEGLRAALSQLDTLLGERRRLCHGRRPRSTEPHLRKLKIIERWLIVLGK